ncbi:hypothetical protein H7X68_03530 [Candidatus Saccharibacteria bacterium]|nr:hypothetical protein [Candidatus Saccharibacteria bacterium]
MIVNNSTDGTTAVSFEWKIAIAASAYLAAGIAFAIYASRKSHDAGRDQDEYDLFGLVFVILWPLFLVLLVFFSKEKIRSIFRK